MPGTPELPGGAGLGDGVTVNADEALLARVRAEAARRRAGEDGGPGGGSVEGSGGSGGGGGVEAEVLRAAGARDRGEASDHDGRVPVVAGYGAFREIGRGGFSRVFEALEFEFQRWVAVKVLDETLDSSEEVAGFERECRLMGVLSRHPNIVTVFASAFTSDERRPCIVMELFPHGSYMDVLQGRGPLEMEELLPLGVQVAGALATAHRQGVVHGDVKPQNIFRSEFAAAALGDFGIATLTHQRAAAAKTRLSLYYAAPELIHSGVSAASPFSDQYSLAATLYTLATGLRPFDTGGDTTAQLLTRMASEPPPRLGEEFPSALDEALHRAMAAEPQNRHRDMAAFADAINEIEGQLGLRSTQAPIARETGRYTGHAPRPTTRPQTQDTPRTPEAPPEHAPAGDTANPDQQPEELSQTLIRPIVPGDTASPDDQQPEEEPGQPPYGRSHGPQPRRRTQHPHTAPAHPDRRPPPPASQQQQQPTAAAGDADSRPTVRPKPREQRRMPRWAKIGTAVVAALAVGVAVALTVSPNWLTVFLSGEGAFAAVSAGDSHTCAIRSSGAVACWGRNVYGQADPPTGAFAAVSAGDSHTCAIRSSGAVACWGRSDYGQADPPTGAFAAVSAGDSHTCAIRSSGAVACWGRSDYGQADPPTGAFAAVSAGDSHTCAIRSSGAALCWGSNVYGQADPPTGAFAAVSAGDSHTCAIRSSGAALCWGSNVSREADPPTGPFQAVTAGLRHSCAIRSDEAIACWGHDANGEVDAPAGAFTAVTAGRHHTCAIRSSGAVACWGANYDGQADVPRGA